MNTDENPPLKRVSYIISTIIMTPAEMFSKGFRPTNSLPASIGVFTKA